MPPTPKIVIEVNPEKFADLCAELNIVQPLVTFKKATNNRYYGMATYATRTLTIYVGLDEQSRDRLPFVHTQAVLTLLHELRHFWQHDHWTPEQKAKAKKGVYPFTEEERDAEAWAMNNAARWRGTVRVHRKFHGSGLSRLSKTERTVRT